jgi:hypothetical protein
MLLNSPKKLIKMILLFCFVCITLFSAFYFLNNTAYADFKILSTEEMKISIGGCYDCRSTEDYCQTHCTTECYVLPFPYCYYVELTDEWICNWGTCTGTYLEVCHMWGCQHVKENFTCDDCESSSYSDWQHACYY